MQQIIIISTKPTTLETQTKATAPMWIDLIITPQRTRNILQRGSERLDRNSAKTGRDRSIIIPEIRQKIEKPATATIELLQ